MRSVERLDLLSVSTVFFEASSMQFLAVACAVRMLTPWRGL